MVQATPPRVRPWALSLAGVVGLGFFVWGLSLGLQPLGDNSFLTHLATGRLIVEDGIPRTDPYSWTAPGTEWVVQSWLASWIYGLVDDWWGSDGLRLLVGLLMGALAAMVWALTRPARSLIARIGVAALVVGVGVGAWSERPLLFGLVCLAVVLLAPAGYLLFPVSLALAALLCAVVAFPMGIPFPSALARTQPDRCSRRRARVAAT